MHFKKCILTAVFPRSASNAKLEYACSRWELDFIAFKILDSQLQSKLMFLCWKSVSSLSQRKKKLIHQQKKLIIGQNNWNVFQFMRLSLMNGFKKGDEIISTVRNVYKDKLGAASRDFGNQSPEMHEMLSDRSRAHIHTYCYTQLKPPEKHEH